MQGSQRVECLDYLLTFSHLMTYYSLLFSIIGGWGDCILNFLGSISS